MKQLLRILLVPAVCTASACATTGASPRPFPTAPGRVVPRAAATAVPHPGLPQPVAMGTSDAGRTATATAIVSTALGFRGVPYRLGGSDPSGFDCSGLVQYVMRQHAIAMPRTVVEQFAVGDTPQAIEPGDLLFFQTIGSGASHVGIAIDAETFVHAPNSRGVVRIERLDSQYWSDRFLGARRVF